MNKIALPPPQPLPDAQAWQGEMSEVGLDWVGMQEIALPLELAGKPLMTKVNVGINLLAARQGSRGIHMSRLYLALDELTQGELTPHCIVQTLNAILASQPEHSDRASLSISGELLLSRPALLSPHRGWKAYPLRIDATLTKALALSLTVGVPYSSTCPSSAALSRQLAQQQFQFDFEQESDRVDRQQVIDWLGEQGMPATPHSQRSEHALGTPSQTLVKRRDEQAFALANGQNLMFCEDAARRLYRMLRSQCGRQGFSLRVEHQESLHAHNAVAELSWREEGDVA